MNQSLVHIRFNWGNVLAFVFFWSYGFYNTTLPGGNTLSTLILACILWTVLHFSQIHKNHFVDFIDLTGKEIILLALLVFVAFIFSFRELTNALVGDDLYHAKASQAHGIFLTEFIMARIPSLQKYQYKHILQVSNVIILALIVATLLILNKIRPQVRISVITISFMAVRFLSAELGAVNHDAHPPFRLFPLWLTSTVLPMSNFSFRFAQMTGWFLLGLFFFRQTIVKFGLLYSILATVAVATIPLLWHVAEIVEQSIWTAVIWSMLAILIASENEKKMNWVRYASILSIFCLMRSSAFAAVPAFGLLMLYTRPFRAEAKPLKKLVVLCLPLLIFIPLTIRNIAFGTPAIDKNLSIAETLLLSLRTGESMRYIYYNITMPWLILPLGWFAVPRPLVVRLGIMAVFFACGYVIFYTIRPAIWGMGRYQAEYALPFFIAGFFILQNRLEPYLLGRKLLFTFVSMAITYNIFYYMNLPSYSKARKDWSAYFNEIKHGGVRIMSDGEGVFNYTEAFAELGKTGLAGYTFICGITYGSFGEILNGFTANEIVKTDQINKQLNTGIGSTMKNIHANPQIRAVLFVECGEPKQKIAALESLGWETGKEFRNARYGSVIYSALRK